MISWNYGDRHKSGSHHGQRASAVLRKSSGYTAISVALAIILTGFGHAQIDAGDAQSQSNQTCLSAKPNCSNLPNYNPEWDYP
jgi:hypothetical protein